MRPAVLQALALAMLIAGCASMETTKAPAPKAPPPAAAKPDAAAKGQEDAGPKHQERARTKGLRAQPTRPLNVKADCSFKDPTGYRGAMKLQVAEARVQHFEATVTVPEHGSCSFALGEFRQT